MNDNVLAIDILSRVNLEGANVLGDKAYGTSEIRKYIADINATYTIPPKTNT
ncbi:MAG: transposase [Eubacterium sp.]|nr:transposase [Eubacterium sp.]MCI8717936.1 transposase [Lachnospiraceae bacterium]